MKNLSPKILPEISFVPYDNKYRSEVVEILEHVWGGDYDKNLQNFKHKYERNPYDKDIYAIVAIQKGKIIGFRGFVPSKWIINTKEVWILLVAEAVVHKNYRRMGVFKGMTEKAIELFQNSKYKGYLNLSSNHKSAKGNLKLGWKQIENKTYHRFTTLWSLLLWSLKLPHRRKVKRKCIRVCSEIKEEELNRVYFKRNVANKMVLSQKVTFYNYKQLRNDNYLFFKCYSQGRLVAFATVKEKHRKATILDLDYESVECMKLIIDELKRFFYIISVWDISILDLGIQDTALSKILRLLEKNKPPFLFRPTKPKYSNEDFKLEGVDLLESKNWDLKNLYVE